MIALVCSVSLEAERLLSAASITRTSTFGSKSIIEGTLAGRSLLLCISGMGKVNAAHAATLILNRYEPRALLSFGIGGAYPSAGAQIGDIAIAEEEIAGDEGVLTHDGFKDTEYIGIPLLKIASSVIHTAYPASKSLVEHARHALAALKPERRTHVGSFITLSTCTGTTARAQELEARYHGLCENMEGAAIAHVALLHNVPWMEVRGISNLVEDRDLAKWDIPGAARIAQVAVQQIVATWNE